MLLCLYLMELYVLSRLNLLSFNFLPSFPCCRESEQFLPFLSKQMKRNFRLLSTEARVDNSTLLSFDSSSLDNFYLCDLMQMQNLFMETYFIQIGSLGVTTCCQHWSHYLVIDDKFYCRPWYLLRNYNSYNCSNTIIYVSSRISEIYFWKKKKT